MGKWAEKSRGNPKNGLGIPRLFAFWKTVLKFRFGTGSAFYRRLTAFSQSNRSRYTRRTMLERLQVRGYAQEIMPNSWMNFKITVT